MKPLGKFLSAFLTAAVLAAVPAPAAAAGSSAAQFLKLGFGARSLGMGEAFVAVADDPSVVYYNPAGLAPYPGGEGRYAAFSHAWHIQDMGISQAAYVARPWGASLSYFSAGELEGRDDNQVRTGNFTASDIALSAGRGWTLGRVRAGATFEYVGQQIKNYSANAVAVNAGALYGLEELPVTFGASVSNLGSKVKFRDESFPLPLIFRAGTAVRLSSARTLLTAQLDLPNDDGGSLRLGAEYSLAESLRLRLGYKTSSSGDRDAILGKELGNAGASGVSGLYGFFFGLGIVYREFNLDYALTPYGDLGNAHRFSLSFKF